MHGHCCDSHVPWPTWHPAAKKTHADCTLWHAELAGDLCVHVWTINVFWPATARSYCWAHVPLDAGIKGSVPMQEGGILTDGSIDGGFSIPGDDARAFLVVDLVSSDSILHQQQAQLSPSHG